MRPVSISAQVEALTNSDSLDARDAAPSRRSASLSLDQRVGGLGVGDAQQRLGQAHQHHALAAGQLVFVQEGVEPAGAHALLARWATRSRASAAMRVRSVLGNRASRDQRIDARVSSAR